MKNKFLALIFGIAIAVSAAVVQEAHSFGSFGTNVNNACAPEVVYSGDCALCHTGSYGNSTPAKTAYLAGGSTLTDYFCPAPQPVDNDGDGYTEDVDCDDFDATINPGAVEICTDGIDNNCNGLVDEVDPTAVDCPVLDGDGDGFTIDQGDCNDNDPTVYPGAVEDCTDGVDNDCDGFVDIQDPNAVGCPVVCTDSDADLYSIEGGDCGTVDCNDSDASINPSAAEVCNDGIDNDCDTRVDCNDNDCTGDPACLLATCEDYTDRNSCKADIRCAYSGKNKACFSLPTEQVNCLENGGRWNKKKAACFTR